TIASRPSSDGLFPALTTADILKYIPQVLEYCSVDCTQILNLDSTNICPSHWISMADCIRKNYEFYDGFVITHGTDTLAYTAAGLSYLIQNSPKPVVLTGAQIPICEENSDAGRNLLDSFLVAVNEKSRGVMIVFSGSVITGTRARKNYTQQFAAFRSMNYPEIARVQAGKVSWYIPQKNSGKIKFYDSLDSRVGLIKLVPGLDEDIMKFILDHYNGVIIECFGVGGLPEYSNFYDIIDQATRKGKLIIMTTQVAYDGSHMDVYQVGHRIKNSLRVLEAYDMTSEAALAKTMWILSLTRDFNEAKKYFYKPVGSDLII
nr:asparaginase [Sphaerochaetaceae bacterium]